MRSATRNKKHQQQTSVFEDAEVETETRFEVIIAWLDIQSEPSLAGIMKSAS